MAVNNKNYIKEYSWSGFKSGVKYSSYLYLGATVASLFAAFASVPGVLTLVASNPVAWAVIGVAFIVLSGVAISVAKPLFHWVRDSINHKKEEGQGRKKVVDGNEKQPESVLNIETESPGSLISNVAVSKRRLFLDSEKYNTFVQATIKKNYKKQLATGELQYIAKSVYRYDADLNFEDNVEPLNPSYGIVFDVIDSNIQPVSHENIKYAIGEHCKQYKEEANKEGGPRVMTLILNLSNHFVTLVTAYDKENGNFRAYYCNPFGNPMQSELSDFLKENLKIEDKDIRSYKIRQQIEGTDYDCGIYALENAHIITETIKTEMVKEVRSFDEIFDEIDRKLAEYVYKDPKQEERRVQGKRREFAKALIDSVSHMSPDEIKDEFGKWR